MLEQLRRLTEALEHLAEGEAGRWREIAPPLDRIAEGLREAVAHSHDPETLRLLGFCWRELTANGGARSAIENFCKAQRRHITDADRPLIAARLHRNACSLVATARAAVEAQRCTQDPGAAGDVMHWLREAAALFGSNRETEAPPVKSEWTRSHPSVLVRLVCDALAAQGVPMDTVRLWTLHWLDGGDSELCRSITVPVAGYEVEGFLMDLRLSVIGRASGDLVEHPDMALRTLGTTMLDTLHTLWKDAPVPACWELRVRDPKFQLLALDGTSLAGAVAIGLRVLRDDLPYDPSCVIVAGVKKNELNAVGHEQEKLDAALKAGFRQAIVGFGTKITDSVIQEKDDHGRALENGRILYVRMLKTVGEALELASGQLTELARVLEAETKRVLEDAKSRIRERKFETWQELDALFVPVKVARGLRPRLSQPEYEELERQRRAGHYDGLDNLARRRVDLREERAQAQLRRPTVNWEHVCAGLRRGVVLGDPGFGKTVLLWHEVGRRNHEWMSKIGRSKAGARQVEVAVFVRALELAQWIGKGEGLIEALIAHRGRQWRVSEANVNLVSAKLSDGSGLIAIDALDEVPQSLREKLDLALAEFGSTHPQARMLLSSRLVGFTRAPIGVAEEDQMETLAFEPAQMEQAVMAWFAPDAEAGADAWSHIQSQADVSGDLRCPLLLHLACGLLEDAQKKASGLPHWERRGELYEGFLRHGVNRWSKTAHPGKQASGLFLDFAGEVALDLWKTDARRTLWAQDAVAQKVDAAQQGHRALELRPDLIGDLCSAGILSLAGADDLETPLMFTHRSFGEYLAARALAKKLGQRGSAEWGLVDRKAWDPDWQEVLVFATGYLTTEDVPRYVGLLADKKKDDYFRHRLTLSALCLGEIPNDRREILSKHVDKITSTTFAFWREICDTDQPAAYVSRALRVLGRVNGRAWGVPLLTTVAQFVHSNDYCERRLGGLAVAAIGAPAATPSIVADLFEWASTVSAELESYGNILDRDVAFSELANAVRSAPPAIVVDRLTNMLACGGFRARWAAVLVREIGRPAATPPIVAELVKLLWDGDRWVRGLVPSALGAIQDLACSNHALAEFAAILRTGNRGSQESVCDALVKLKDQAASREVVDACVVLLEREASRILSFRLHTNRNALCSARWSGEAAAALGAPAITRVIRRASAMLLSKDRFSRQLAFAMLGTLGQPARDPQILAALSEALRSNDLEEIACAAYALAFMGKSAASPEVLAELARMLASAVPDVRRHAAFAIGGEFLTGLHSAAATRPILRILERYLRASNGEMRMEAATIIGALGPPAADPAIISSLIRLLRRADSERKADLALILAELGSTAVEVLEAIQALLDESGRLPRLGGALLAERLGRAACTDGIVSSLNRLLYSRDWTLQSGAARALGEMTPSPFISKTIVERLSKLLWSDSMEVFVAAVEALGRIPPRGMTSEMILRIADLCGRDTLNDEDAAVATLDKFHSECRLVPIRSKRSRARWLVREISALARVNG